MAYQTRRSQGQWSSVRSYSTYGNVISNYASALQQVQESSDNVELQKKVMEYKNGTATYQDVVNLVNARLGAAIPNSQRELDLREVLLGLEDYETSKNRDIKRAELRSKYAKGGISAQEELLIQKQMLQFYKEGTADYSEQLSNIAVATELAGQENKNARIAQMQAQLAEGGLTTDEEIGLYEEGRDMSEPGTEEYATFERKINEAKTRKEQEDTEQEANEKYLELLDKYKDGGITDQENLEIVRELQTIYKPGSEEYTKMKETEADLLGSLAKGSGGGSGQAAERQQAQVEFQAIEAALAEQQQKLEQGINPAQALEQQFNLLQQQQELINTYGDVAPDEGLGNFQANFQRISELKNQINTGNAVIVKRGNSTAIVPLNELGAYAEKGTLGALNEKGELTEGTIGAGIITIIDEDGTEKQVIVGPKGQLEEVAPTGFVGEGNKDIYQRTGKLLDYGTRTQSKISANVPGTAPTGSSGDVLGASTSSVTKTSSQSKTPSVSKPKSSGGGSGGGGGSVKSPTSTASKIASTVSQVKSAVSKSGPTAGAYGGTGKVLSAGIKPGNIKGTIDIGVTEAISSAAKKAVSTAKNILGSLFKKK